MKALVSVLGLAVLLSAGPGGAIWANEGRDLENTLYLELRTGRVVIELKPDVAPNHVARIKKLAREKFYDGIVFHRVIEDFMAQTGDPTGTGTGGSPYPDLEQEFNAMPHYRGVLSMARSQNPNSASSQFFICDGAQAFLDDNYATFGRTVEGMDVVRAIAAVATGANDKPVENVTMVKVTIE